MPEPRIITARPVQISQHIPTMAALLREHWQENEQALVPAGPKPMIEVYQALETAGMVEAFAAFDGDAMIGYVVSFVVPQHHYGLRMTQHDVLFVAKAHRSSTVGMRLIKMAEAAHDQRGADLHCWHAKPGSSLEKILLHRGYQHEENLFVRRTPCPSPH